MVCILPGTAENAVRGAAVAALALAATFAQSGQAAGFTEYLGGGFIQVREGCEDFGWSGTHQVMIRMQPQGMQGNPEDETQMALIMGTGTIAVRLDIDRGVRRSYVPTEATYIWNGPYSPEEPTMSFSFDPDGSWLLNETASMDRFHAIVENFNEHEGCRVELFGSLYRN